MTELRLMRAFVEVCAAFYLGDPQPGESLVQAHARALGYQSSREYCDAVEARDPDVFKRIASTNNLVKAKFGVDFKHDFVHNFDKILEAFGRMEAGFSEFYKRIWDELRSTIQRRPFADEAKHRQRCLRKSRVFTRDDLQRPR